MSNQDEDIPYLDMPCPPKMREWADDIYDWFLENRSVQGPGVFIDDAPGGGKRFSAYGGVGTVGSSIYPFYVFFRNTSTNPSEPNWQRLIYKESPVQQSQDHNDLIYLDGLADNDNPSMASTGLWKDTDDGDFIWGKLTFDPAMNPTAPFTITASTINSTSAGQMFPTGGEAEYLDIGDPSAMPPTHIYAQTALRFPIALISIPDGKPPFVKVPWTRNVVRLGQNPVTAVLMDGTMPRDIEGLTYFT